MAIRHTHIAAHSAIDRSPPRAKLLAFYGYNRSVDPSVSIYLVLELREEVGSLPFGPYRPISLAR